MPADERFSFTMDLDEGYRFLVDFDQEAVPALVLDEPAPLGAGSGPNASRLLAAAAGNCLSASLLFCARKGRIETGPIRTKITVHSGRNERGRLRIVRVQAEIDPQLPEAEKPKALRCLDLFEDYCVVTQSIRQGIPVEVTVKGLEDLRISARQ